MSDEKKINWHQLKVQVASTGRAGIIQPAACQNGILPKCHCSYLVVGKSGSGKSNVVIHMLKSKALLAGAFNYTFYLTGSPDDSFTANIKIPKENIIRGFDDLKFLRNLLAKQKALIDKVGIEKASKTNSVVLMFDDILGFPKFLKSDMLLKLVTECRHYLVTCIFNTQSYKKIARSVRVNCRGIIFFPSSRGEMEVFTEEQCLPNMTKKRFMHLLEHATDDEYQFAFIQGDAAPRSRLRKNFDTLIS